MLLLLLLLALGRRLALEGVLLQRRTQRPCNCKPPRRREMQL